MRGSVSVLLLRPILAAVPTGPAKIALLSSCELTEPMITSEEARITALQFRAAWAALVRLADNPQIALRIAAETPAGAFGLVEYVCRSAPTVGEALRQWARFLNLLDDTVTMGLVMEGGQGCLRVLRESDTPAPQAHELCFAQVAAQIAQICSRPIRVARVQFTHTPTGDLDAYSAWFGGAPVRFGAEVSEMVFDREALDIPLVSADPALLAILTRVAEGMAHAGHEPPGVAPQVRRVLAARMREDDADIDTVARVLGMSARSLQRRLKEEQTSFQGEREGTRKTLAYQYLAQRLSTAEISFLLGFSEPSAFFRAFKRWTGHTPVEYRMELA